jgi:hypothetical protein
MVNKAAHLRARRRRLGSRRRHRALAEVIGPPCATGRRRGLRGPQPPDLRSPGHPSDRSSSRSRRSNRVIERGEGEEAGGTTTRGSRWGERAREGSSAPRGQWPRVALSHRGGVRKRSREQSTAADVDGCVEERERAAVPLECRIQVLYGGRRQLLRRPASDCTAESKHEISGFQRLVHRIQASIH